MGNSTVKILLLSIIMGITTTFSSCDHPLFDQRISEGIIEYTIEYPEMDPENIMFEFMPEKMVMKFKDNVFVTELSAGMGMFKTNFVSNSNDYSLKQIVKLVNKKFACVFNSKEEADVIHDYYSDFSVIDVSDHEVIAGYDCKKALVVFNDVTKSSFYIYYTDQIRIKDPNWSIPFRHIEGVLLEYQMERNGIVMRFKATQVLEAEIDETEFEVPEDYAPIGYDDLEKEMNDIFDTFNY